MESGVNHAFVLKDHFTYNPFREIYSKRREDTHFFNVHSDYLQHLRYMAIIWNRIKNECREIEVYHAQDEMTLYEVSPAEWMSPNIKEERVLTTCQCDFETFVMFARRFMDKIGKLIEILIQVPKGIALPMGFTDHKKWFIENKKIHPNYSDLLEKRTYWYDRDLLLLRDKVIGHGGTLTSGAIVSPHTGIGFRKSYGISPLKGLNKDKFLQIKKRYEERYSCLRIPENDFEMLNEFVREIRRNDIRLEEGQKNKKGDLKILGDIVQYSGIVVDEEYLESIAGNIEDFIQEAASIFKH